MNNSPENIPFVFFGTPQLAVTVLGELKSAGLLPSLIVTAPDRPQGRHLTLTPPPVKVWAEQNSIPFIQPEKITDEIVEKLSVEQAKLFVVVAYGKILKQKVLDIPPLGTINVHPSLLPLYRGPAPIEGPILNGDSETGVSIMYLDAEVDHGPVLTQEKIPLQGTETTSELENTLAHLGGKLLAQTITDLVEGKVIPTEQDHIRTTFTKKITKADGHIDLSADPIQNERKIRAFDAWPGTYFFTKHLDRDFRIIIKKAHLENGELIIDRVIPEGKKEMNYADFLNGFN